MLLLVVQAEFDERADVGVGSRASIEERGHRGVDVAAVPADVGDGRARQQPAFGPRVPGPTAS